MLESLEARVVPAQLVSYVLGGTASTTIVGTVYEDLDKNGVRNNGENGVSGWTVYLDLDNSGTLNRDAVGDLEPSALTNKDGDFIIGHLRPGTYRLAEIVQPGWDPTTPAFQDVNVINDQDNKADFFNFSGGGITGTVWNDLDQDGVRATDPTTGAFTEPGLSGWTVFLDLNNDKAPTPGEPVTITDAEGAYRFSDLAPGDYEVTEVLPGNWDVSKGFDIRQTAAVTARKDFTQDFANFSLGDGSIRGTIWNDMNADGIRAVDPGTGVFSDPGLEGWTVFIDSNANGVLDSGESSTKTNAAGDYQFVSLPAGDYEVAEVLPPDWNLSPGFDSRQTVAVDAGAECMAGDFANFTVLNGSIRGVVWNDLNRNGVRNTDIGGAFSEPGIADWSVYLDMNRNGVFDAGEPIAVTDASGNYLLADLQVGDYEIREILPTGWEPTAGYSDSYAVTVYSGTETAAHDFGNFNVATAVPGSISGTIWNDLNGNGLRDKDSGTGAFTDPGLSGWSVYVDLNNNGSMDAGEPSAVSGADGGYTITGVLPGTINLVEQVNSGWKAYLPITGKTSLTLRNAESAAGLDFANQALKNSTIAGKLFSDSNKDGLFTNGEKGLANITVFLDSNNNGFLDSGEPSTLTSADQFFTPGQDESGTYSFSHLAAGSYPVRVILPAELGATPADQLVKNVTLSGGEGRPDVDFAARYRANEIHGVEFEDLNGNHQRDPGDSAQAGVTIFIDLDRDNVLDPGEPTTSTGADGSYSFTGLTPGAYVVREVAGSGKQTSYPATAGGILWPQGTSNPASGNVSPVSITDSLAVGQVHRETVSITLPGAGSLTNLVDVFLLFDDTGSFVNNSPLVRSAFPSIISQLQTSLPGIDLGFGVGRFEEYGNFAAEYSSGRPFILNQPIVASSTPGYMTSIQAALNRTTPGYGGDQPETDIEALYQLVTGLGFDGNNNGSVLDSGSAGLVSTQLNPGSSGDVPSFASFRADPSGSVMAAAGNVGGGGFRSGALPIILVATDTGFAYQPKGETTITGASGVTLPLNSFTQTSRPTTPFNSGAGIQETITGLNALGALVIGLGTNTQANIDPRQGLESLSKLTGAVNRSTTTIANGTADPIAPGDPLYFQISSGFAGSVSNGVVNAIQNAVTSVAVDITIQASDPRVKIINHTGVRTGVGSGQTASFDFEIVGDGVPHRFDLQFVRNGTNVILGSIPVVLGTPVPGDGYEFEDLAEGEIHSSVDFGSTAVTAEVHAPSIKVTGGLFTFDNTVHVASATVLGIGGVPVPGSFTFTYNGSEVAPTAAGTYSVVATFTSSDTAYSNGTGTGILTIQAATPVLSVLGGVITYDALSHGATATATGVGGVPVSGSFTFTYEGSSLEPTAAGTYAVVATFTSNDANYANASGTATLTIVSTVSTITVAGGSYTYDGAAHVATATAVGIGGVTIPGTFAYTYNGSSTAPTVAGSYSVVATFTSADPSYSDSTGTGTLTIGTAPPTITVTGGSYTYDGAAHVATATAVGIGGVTIPGTFAYTYNGSSTAPTVAGSYSVVATFTSADPNYSDSTGTGTLIIGTAPPTITVTGGSYTYDGAAHVATATAVGIGGVTIPGTFAYTYNGSSTAPTVAGSYSVVATFTSADPNYSDSTGTGTLIIGTAPPTITVTGGSYTYDGLTHVATATAVGIGGVTIPGSFAFTYNGSSTAPTAAGNYSVVVTFTSADPSYSDSTGTGTLTIGTAPPTITVTGGSYTYDGNAHAATATAVGIGGVTLPGSFAFTYNGSSTAPTAAGNYSVVATFTSADPNYSDSTGTGTLTINRATPVFSALSSPTITAGTTVVALGGHIAAGAVFPVGESVLVSLNGATLPATVDSAGNFAVNFPAGSLVSGTYPVTFDYQGLGVNFTPATGSSLLTVSAAAQGIEAIGVNIAVTAGAPATATVATLVNSLGSASAYGATISWGDGYFSVGTVTGNGATLQVVGTHTYASPGSAPIVVTLRDNLGLGLTATTTGVATVTSLGQKAGSSQEAEFWKKAPGQALIRAFNGGSTKMDLGNWLASNFPNLYGANAGGSNMTGKTNAFIADYFKALWRSVGDGAASQVLATALNVYATTKSLGGEQGVLFGFQVSVTGLGARSFDVGNFGAAVGVPNKTRMIVFEMLRAVDRMARNGNQYGHRDPLSYQHHDRADKVIRSSNLYGGDRMLLAMAKELFSNLNSI